MPVTFQVVGNLADFGNDARAGVKVRATASPGHKVGDEAVHSNQPETVVTDIDGAFALELVSLPGVWYRIHTPYSGGLPTINLAGYVPDVDDPTTGTVFPEDTVIDVKDVADENPSPGYEAVLMGPVGPQGATGPKGDKGDTGDTGPAGTTDYNALANKPTLGTAAATDATDYATAAQGAAAEAATATAVPLPAPTGTNDTTAIQAVLTANAGKRIVGRTGAAYKISAPLVISSGTTLDMTGCTITLLAGSNSRMIQNAALSGSGARDTDIHLVGGYWDRGANGGTLPNDLHSIVIHRADRVSVAGVRFTATGPCKYSVYLVDVTDALVEGCHLTTTSDGVHVTGPASDVTVRDIMGQTDDDLVSFTGRDYPNYELTAGGGAISNVTVENVTHRGTGSGNAVKLVPGAATTMSRVAVRNVQIGAATGTYGVFIMSDAAQASTTGGTVTDVTIDGIRCGSVGAVACTVPTVGLLTVRNVYMTSLNTAAQTVRVVGTGAVVSTLVIDGVSTVPAFIGVAGVHVDTGATVTTLKMSNVLADNGTGANSYLFRIYGTTGNVQMQNLTVNGGWIGSVSGTMPLLAIDGLHAAGAAKSIIIASAANSDVTVTNVTAPSAEGYIVDNYSTNSTVTLRGAGIAGTAAQHIHKSASNTPKTRAVGLAVRADVSLLTPVAGDVAYNTNAALGCGTGPVISNGTLWKHLYTGATT